MLSVASRFIGVDEGKIRKEKLGRRALRSSVQLHLTKVFRVITFYLCYCINLYNNHKNNNIIDIICTNYKGLSKQVFFLK